MIWQQLLSLLGWGRKKGKTRKWWLCPCGWYMAYECKSCCCGYTRPLFVDLLKELPDNADYGYTMTEEELADAIKNPNATGVGESRWVYKDGEWEVQEEEGT